MSGSWSRTCSWAALLGVILTSAIGCSSGSAERSAATGKLQMWLEGTSASGVKYRLRAATFTITGPTQATVSTEDDPAATSISVELEVGEYLIQLEPGWYLERAEPDGSFVQVTAVLLSDNPAVFTIADQQTTSVQFRFRAGNPVEPGSGVVVIGIEVEDGPGFGCEGSTPDNPRVMIEFLPVHEVKWVEAVLPIPSSPGQFWVATQQQGSYCGGGTPAAIWKVTVDPSGGPAQIEHLQDLAKTVSTRAVLFRASDGTLFTGGGWCGYNPPYYSVDDGVTWLPADAGAVHPPNNTFTIGEFQGSVYAGTGYVPYPGQVYRWLGAGNWELVLDPQPTKHIIGALKSFKGRLFVGTTPPGCPAGDVPVYVSNDGRDFAPTTGIPPCAGVSFFQEAGANLYAWGGTAAGSTVHRWNEATETWEPVSSFSPVNGSSTGAPFLGNAAYFSFAGVNSLTGEGIYTSPDYGLTWSLLVSMPQPATVQVFDRILYWTANADQVPRVYCLPL